MIKMKQEEAKLARVRGMLANISNAVGFELALYTKKGGSTPLNRWQVVKWLTYEQMKEQAADSVREELARVQAEIARVRKAKGVKVRAWIGKGAPWANRAEQLERLLEELNEWTGRTMKNEADEEWDLANDDSDCFYDEDAWSMGDKYDPDFNKPIVEWAKIEVKS